MSKDMPKEKAPTNNKSKQLEKNREEKLEKKKEIPKDKIETAAAAKETVGLLKRAKEAVRKNLAKSTIIGLGAMMAAPGVASNLENANQKADKEFLNQDRNRVINTQGNQNEYQISPKRSKSEAKRDYQAQAGDFNKSQEGAKVGGGEWKATSPDGSKVEYFNSKEERDAFLADRGYSPEGEYVGPGKNANANNMNSGPRVNLNSDAGAIDRFVSSLGENIKFRFTSPDGNRHKDFNSMRELENFARSVNNRVDRKTILVVKSGGSVEFLPDFLSKNVYQGSSSNESFDNNSTRNRGNENLERRQERAPNFTDLVNSIPEGKGQIAQENEDGTITYYEVSKKGDTVKIKRKGTMLKY